MRPADDSPRPLAQADPAPPRIATPADRVARRCCRSSSSLVGGIVLLTIASLTRKRAATAAGTRSTRWSSRWPRRPSPRAAVGPGAGLGQAPGLDRHRRRRPRGPFSTAAGAVGIDGFGLFVDRRHLRRGDPRRAAGRRLPAPRGPRRPRVLRPACCCRPSGGVIMAMANDLIVLFLGLEMLSIAVYVLVGHAPAPGPVAGGAASSTSCSARSRRRSSSTASPSSTAPPARPTSSASATIDELPRPRHHVPARADQRRLLLARPRAAARRVRLQGRGRAVPLLEPRRVRRRAHPVGRLHGRRR